MQTDTIYTLLTPTGITVVPGTVKAALGAPVVPTVSAPRVNDCARPLDVCSGSSSGVGPP